MALLTCKLIPNTYTQLNLLTRNFIYDLLSGYAYLIVDGHRLPIPKKILNSEYLKLADEGVSSSKDNLSSTNSATSSTEILAKKEEPPQLGSVASDMQGPAPTSVPQSQLVAELYDQKTECDNSELMSHCSAVGSCFSEIESGSDKNSRLFIFPQNCPGFEVVYPVLDVPENTTEDYKWSESGK